MLRANFFKFFKYKKNSNHEIVQYNSNKNFSVQDQIKTNIIEIDQKILENNGASNNGDRKYSAFKLCINFGTEF